MNTLHVYDRLVAEIPPTSGVVATPDVLVVKLVPDASSTTNVVLGCYSLCAVLILHYAVQQIVGVSTNTRDATIHCVQKNM